MDFDFGKTFLLLCEKLNIGEHTFCEIKKKYHFEITLEEFYQLNNLGLIYDGSKGGLVLGKSHKEGGVHFLQQCAEERLRYIGEMEGWEYLTLPIRDENIGQQFENINRLTPHLSAEIQTDFEIPKSCKVIDTRETDVPILLVSGVSQFVINRFATKKEIRKIIELDK